MSTNYYMRLKEPERSAVRLSEVADRAWSGRLADPDMPVELADRHVVHIAKCSWGHPPSFQRTPSPGSRYREGGPSGPDGADRRYSISSVGDIRSYMATGDYEIIDGYGDVLTWEEFDRQVLHWADRMRELGFEGEVSGHLDDNVLGGYEDPEGYLFYSVPYS